MRRIFVLLLIASILFLLGFFYIRSLPFYYKPTATENLHGGYLTLYKSCNKDLLGEKCKNGECIDDGMEKRIFGLWKKQFIIMNNLDESYFNNHIIINDVVYKEILLTYSNKWQRSWRVDYVFVNDWVRTRQNDGITLYEYQDPSLITDKIITEKLNKVVRYEEGLKTPIIPYSKLLSLARKEKANLDYCHISLTTDGHLQITGFSYDLAAIISNNFGNGCRRERVVIDLKSGSLTKTLLTDCVILPRIIF